MMLSDEETRNKASLEDLLDKYSETQSKKFEDMLDKCLETHVESKIAKALEPINKRLDALEKRASANRASSAPPSEFVPNFEIKGFVDKFEEAWEKGMTKDKASELVEKLKECSPEELKDCVGDIELKGERNFAVKVMINDKVNRVHSRWKKFLRENPVGRRDLFVTAQRSPEKKQQYDSLG